MHNDTRDSGFRAVISERPNGQGAASLEMRARASLDDLSAFTKKNEPKGEDVHLFFR